MNFLFGLVSGVVLALVSPLAKWIFEMLRMRQESRKQAIQDCASLAKADDFTLQDFRNSPEYFRLRSAFSKPVQAQINMDAIRVIITDRSVARADRQIVLDELARIERRWKLL
jgi:hypothetical protein